MKQGLKKWRLVLVLSAILISIVGFHALITAIMYSYLLLLTHFIGV
jgi:hypothetical protein